MVARSGNHRFDAFRDHSGVKLDSKVAGYHHLKAPQQSEMKEEKVRLRTKDLSSRLNLLGVGVRPNIVVNGVTHCPTLSMRPTNQSSVVQESA